MDGGGAARLIRRWWRDFMGVLFPRVCHVCGTTLVEGEEVMCLDCNLKLPRTNFHHNPSNDMLQRLASTRVVVDRAAAYFHYVKQSPYARLIHLAKYNGLPRVARIMARDFARQLSDDNFFDGIDLLLPVPLHRSKLRRRGYNQAHEIARGVSEVTGIEIGHNLVAERPHSTQTHLNAYQRWRNTSMVYSATDPASLAGKHVVIIDDVITTGATILACAEAIAALSPTTRISVLTLAATHRS